MDISYIGGAVIVFLLGAFGRRISGGLIRLPSTQEGRVVWGVTVAIPVLAGSLQWQLALAVGVAVAVSGILVGFIGGCLSMGFTRDTLGQTVWGGWKPFLKAFGWMTLHGITPMILAAPAVWYYGHPLWPLAIAGLACAPAYTLAWLAPLNAPWLGCEVYVPGKHPADPPPTAELLWGGIVGLCLWLVALL